MSEDEQLKNIVAKVLDIDPNNVGDDLARGKTESWDSLNHLLLVSEIESQMGVEFTTDEVLEMNSFKELKEIISRKKARKI